MSNEDDVIDRIGQLVDRQLSASPHTSSPRDRCPQCFGEWHGFIKEHCPGPFGRDFPKAPPYVAWATTSGSFLAAYCFDCGEVHLTDDPLKRDGWTRCYHMGHAVIYGYWNT